MSSCRLQRASYCSTMARRTLSPTSPQDTPTTVPWASSTTSSMPMSSSSPSSRSSSRRRPELARAPMTDRPKTKKKSSLPTKQQILDFIRESPTPVGKREIARAFGVSGGDRIPLKAMLREIAAEGVVERGRGRRLARPKSLPETAVVQIVGVDPDGEVLARPVAWTDDSRPPKILMAPERRGTPALAEGDRVLARLARIGPDLYEGRTIRQLAGVPQRVVGVYEAIPGVGGRLRPTDRRVKTEYCIAANDAGSA